MRIVQQLRDYSPTKTTLFWSVAGGVVATMIVGFTWGGWVTGGTATEMAEEAAEQASAKLAAIICVERFVNADDAAAQLASLKETSRWQRRKFVEEGNWTTLTGMEEPVDGAAEICAAQLADMELPVDTAGTTGTTDTTANTESAIQ